MKFRNFLIPVYFLLSIHFILAVDLSTQLSQFEEYKNLIQSQNRIEILKKQNVVMGVGETHDALVTSHRPSVVMLSFAEKKASLRTSLKLMPGQVVKVKVVGHNKDDDWCDVEPVYY